MEIRADEAVILRHLDYGEADRIVTFFTRSHGRLKGFARGARKSRRRFGPALEPFARVRVHWSAPRRGELVSLRETELLDLRAGLRAELTAIALAGYGCELVEALFPEGEAQEELFDLLGAFLDHLAAGGAGAEARLLCELRLLDLAGYLPHLLHCAHCGETLRGDTVAFAAERGGSLCLACAGGGDARLSPLTLGTLARCLRAPRTLFAGFRFSARTLAEGEGLLADALRPHLSRPLRSLAFLEQTAKAAKAPQER